MGLAACAAVRAADVVVVAMGNDGALASVVAGLVEAPVIAVPTSVGYGASLQARNQAPWHCGIEMMLFANWEYAVTSCR